MCIMGVWGKVVYCGVWGKKERKRILMVKEHNVELPTTYTLHYTQQPVT